MPELKYHFFNPKEPYHPQFMRIIKIIENQLIGATELPVIRIKYVHGAGTVNNGFSKTIKGFMLGRGILISMVGVSAYEENLVVTDFVDRVDETCKVCNTEVYFYSLISDRKICLHCRKLYEEQFEKETTYGKAKVTRKSLI